MPQATAAQLAQQTVAQLQQQSRQFNTQQLGVPKTGRAAKGMSKAQQLGVSALRGVRKAASSKIKKPWQVASRHQGKVLTGGHYATEEEASDAHDKRARLHTAWLFQ